MYVGNVCSPISYTYSITYYTVTSEVNLAWAKIIEKNVGDQINAAIIWRGQRGEI